MLGARVLGEFGDDPERYESAKSRRNYAGTSPLTVASGRKRSVRARFVRNRRLADAVAAGRSARCGRARAATTSTSGGEPPATSITRRCAPSPTASSATSTAACGPGYEEATAWAHRHDREPLAGPVSTMGCLSLGLGRGEGSPRASAARWSRTPRSDRRPFRAATARASAAGASIGTRGYLQGPRAPIPEEHARWLTRGNPARPGFFFDVSVSRLRAPPRVEREPERALRGVQCAGSA